MSLSLEKIGGILLKIAAGAVILIVLLFPTGLYAKAVEQTKPWADNVYKLMHKEKEEKNEQETPKEIEDMFNNLIDDLNKDTPSNNCLLTHTPFVNDFKDYYIKISNSKDETSAYLYKENVLFFGPEKIKKKVCVVDTENFYDNYLDKTPCTTNCKQNYKEVKEIEIIDKEKIMFNGKEYDLEDLNLMFKADNDHICFFPTKDGNSLCDADEFVLDDNCLLNIMQNPEKYQLKNCEEDTTIMFYKGEFFGLRKDWRYDGRNYKYTGNDQRVAYIYKKDGLYKDYFEPALRGPYEKVPEGKQGVFYMFDHSLDKEGKYYGLKQHWKRAETNFLRDGIGKHWIYDGPENEVSERRIDNVVYENVFGPPKIE